MDKAQNNLGLLFAWTVATPIFPGIKVKEKWLSLRANIEEISVFETVCFVQWESCPLQSIGSISIHHSFNKHMASVGFSAMFIKITQVIAPALT